MRPRWEKVLTDLWGNLTRSALVIASISVGLLAIGIIATVYVVLTEDMRSSYLAIHAPNINIQTSLINDDMIKHINHLSGVDQAIGVRSATLRIENAKGEWQSITIKAYKDMESMPISKLNLIEGQFPQDGEIVIATSRLAELNSRTGDEVLIDLPSNKTRRLKLVGVVQDQTIGAYGNAGGFYNETIQGYVHQDTLDKLEQSNPYLYNGVYITTLSDGSDLNTIREIANSVTHNLKMNNVTVHSSKPINSDNHPNNAVVDAVGYILLILGFLSVFLSSFLVTNTLQALLKQQTQQIGIMKSIGAQQLQIMGLYIALIMTFGVLAFSIAMPLSNFAAYQLLTFLTEKLNFSLGGKRLEIAIVILQAVLALLMPTLAAWQSVWQGSKISVIEALSGGMRRTGNKPGTSKGKRPFTYRIQTLKIDLPEIIAIRNTFREKWRLILTLITLSLGGAIFIATFNVSYSVDQYVSRVKQYFVSDVNVVLKHTYSKQKITSILGQIPDVGSIEAWSLASGKMIMEDGSTGERVSLIAPPVDSNNIKPVMISGRWIKAGDHNAIVLSDTFKLHFPDIQAGDSLHIKINDKNTHWEVIGFFQLAGKLSGYTTYTDYDSLAEVVDTPSRTANYQIVGNKKKLSDAEQEALKRSVESCLDAEKIQIASLTTGHADSTTSSGGLTTLTTFLLIMSILIALVGCIGLAGTMSMNVMERTHEIGVLRSIGASDRTLMQIVLSEGVTTGVISYIIAVLLSFPITKLLGNGVIMAIFNTSANIAFTATGFVIWLFLVLALSIIASIIPARNATRLTIREVLSYE